jgi:SAM-dependent methyltransferase
MSTFAYIGSELDLFAAATNWKRYLRAQIVPYLKETVLEVGAGFGATTRVLFHAQCQRWLCLEPDAALLDRLRERVTSGELPDCCEPVLGTIDDLRPEEVFDTILYIDVLEHIEDDRSEFCRAATRLRPGGYLIILCPAHQWLYSPFDAALGHWRRYTTRQYKAFTSRDMKMVVVKYLDAIGMLASLSNGFLLKQSLPTPRQIAFWDKVMVPCSRGLDVLFAYSIGKSVLGIWTRV